MVPAHGPVPLVAGCPLPSRIVSFAILSALSSGGLASALTFLAYVNCDLTNHATLKTGLFSARTVAAQRIGNEIHFFWGRYLSPSAPSNEVFAPAGTESQRKRRQSTGLAAARSDETAPVISIFRRLAIHLVVRREISLSRQLKANPRGTPCTHGSRLSRYAVGIGRIT